jgi:hypothetical protein
LPDAVLTGAAFEIHPDGTIVVLLKGALPAQESEEDAIT